MNPLASLKFGSMMWHAIKRFASVLFVGGLLWAIYVMAIKPHINPTPTESQTADEIANYNFNLKPHQTFFGCANYRIQNPKELVKEKAKK